MAALALVLAVALAGSARAWSFLCDDAFISFRYARNLARHGALEFNLGERVEGYTNFAWVVLLAGFDAVGLAPETVAPVLNAAAAAATVAASAWLLRGLRGWPGSSPTADPNPAWLGPIDLVPGALLVGLPEFAVWSSGGLETSTAAATTIGALAAFVFGRWRTAGTLAAAAALTRPDALLPIATFAIGWGLTRSGPALVRDRGLWRRLPWRRLGQALLLLVVPVLAHLLWRRAYYGAWVPNTWTIKAHGALLRPTYGIAYVWAWVQALHLVALTPLVLLVRPRHLTLVLPAAAVVAYGWSVGGDFMAYSRFYVVATVLVATLVGWLLADGARILARVAARGAAEATAVGVGLVLALAVGVEARTRHRQDRDVGVKWIDGQWEGVTAMDRFARVGLAVGRWMHTNLPPDTTITVGAAGAVPYGAQLTVIDAYGLVDPVIASLPTVEPHRGKGARPGHQLMAPVSYIERRDPDLLCHVGYRGPRPPPERAAHPAFRRGYRWACIDPGPIMDPTAATGLMPPVVYCCRRPESREVGPFGAEQGERVDP